MHTVGQSVIPLFLSRSPTGLLLSILICPEVFFGFWGFFCFFGCGIFVLFFRSVLLECFGGFYFLNLQRDCAVFWLLVSWGVEITLYSEQLGKGTTALVCAPFIRVNLANVF